jgi:hypothetical protein
VGRSVSSGGDINGDGLAEILIGAVPTNNAAGKTYVIFGNTEAGLEATLTGANTTAGFNLDLLSGGASGGFQITHDTEMQTIFGSAGTFGNGFTVAAAGDVNGDGFGDIIIGAPMAGSSFALGAAYMVYGKASGFSNISLGSLNGSNGFAIIGWLNTALNGSRAGTSVAGVGDVNGDGFDDVLVGAPAFNQAYLIFGGTTATLQSRLTTDVFGGDGVAAGNGYNFAFRTVTTFFDSAHNGAAPVGTSLLNGTNGVLLTGGATSDAGRSVSGVGDVNGDGYADILIGAPTAQGGSGQAIGAGEGDLVYGGNYDNKASIITSSTATATAAGQSLIGTTGNDTLDSGAAFANVTMRGGAGNDTLIVNGLERSVDGGGGFDTLRLRAGTTALDFSNLPDSRHAGIEKIDVSGNGATDTITLNVRDLLDLSGTLHTLFIKADTADFVNAKVLAGDTGWVRNSGADVATDPGGGAPIGAGADTTWNAYDYVGGGATPSSTVARLYIDPSIDNPTHFIHV